MDFRFAAYDPQTGDFLYSLPRPSEVQIGDVFGTRGTLSLTLAKSAPNYRDLPTFVEIRTEVTFGADWQQVGPALLRLSGDHEDTDQSGMRKREFVGFEWKLGKARVGVGTIPLIDGKRPFYRATPGQIMRSLILEAQDRGAAQSIDLGTMTNTHDSAGNEWTRLTTIYYSPGLPIGSVLENLVEQGMCDYRMNGHTLEMFEPETEMGRDLTTGPNPVRIHGAISEAPVKYTVEEVVNNALLIGDDGFKLEVDNPSAPNEYGRLEATIEQGGVSDPGTARLMIDEALQKGAREVREITRTQTSTDALFLPYRDYRVGDYVQVLTDGAWQRYRVRELQLTREAAGWKIHVVLNDRMQELLLKLAKRTSGIVNGSSGSGGDGTRPAPEFPPGIEPLPPRGLLVDQQVYLDDAGTALGQATVSWAPVTEGVTGQPVRVGGYELWTRRNEAGAEWYRQTTTDDTTANHSGISLTNPDGTPAEYQWRVRAVAEASQRLSDWSETVTLTMTQDTEPPPTPSTPLVSTEFRSIMVEWDRLDHNGREMPADFSRAPIYFAADQSMTNPTLAGALSYPGVWTSGPMPADVPVWVAMAAVDRVGNESPMTPAVEIVPRQLVNDESIQDAIEDAKRDAIDEAVTTAGGRQVHNKTEPPTASPDDEEHDVWQQWTTLDADGTLVAVWVHDGTQWVEGDLDEQYVPRINIGEGTFGTLSGGRLEANTVDARALIVGGPTNLIPGAESWATTNAGWTEFEWSPGDGFLTTTGENILYTDEPFVLPGGDYYMGARITSSGGTGRAYVGVYSEHWPDDGTAGYRYGLTNFNGTAETVFTVPPGGVTATLRILTGYQGSLGDTGTSWVNEVIMRPMVGATVIQDGAILTDKLAANAVQADKIDAGAIDGKIITGATVRTSASGARVQMNPTGLYAYNPSNEQTFSISANTGAVSMTGNLYQRNSYAAMRVGPNLYDDWDTSPAVAFQRHGTTPWGSAGMLLSGTSLEIQGTLVNEGQGAWLRLPLHGESQDAGIVRSFNAGDASSVALSSNRNVSLFSSEGNVYADSRGNDSGVFMRTYYGSRSHAQAFMSVDNVGSAFIETVVGSNSDAVTGRLSMGSDGTWLRAGSGNTATASRNLYLQAYGNAHVYAYGTGNSPSLNAYLDVLGDGNTYWQGDRMYIGTLPNSSGAVPIGRVSGQLHSVSSSRKYKLLEEPIDARDEGMEDRLLSVPVKTWIDKTAAERLAAHHTAVELGEDPEDDLVGCGTLERFPGVVAEDLHDAGLGMFVGYENGEPEWVMYDRIGPALIPIIRRLRDRVEALETQLGAA